MEETDFLQNRILDELNLLINHLDKYEEKNWSDYFRKVQRLIDNGDVRGVDSLNTIRGGMGSFNDLVISKMNGHKVEKNGENFANLELMKISKLVFKSVDELKRLIK
ncbi:DUF6966 domain-containing protein [Flammeovirga agarivorans]|uniref:DUF6966 domain-containing protein n=1 Tax=Flammeovirga agarivorans TaxID=2726742 RepID=A0A7X8SRL5_9BACT|nr:hypothetical protein [Flammeovirga agarivorans]NLR95095.1 hypothetical protein [Flammeovirga agarivorans]